MQAASRLVATAGLVLGATLGPFVPPSGARALAPGESAQSPDSVEVRPDSAEQDPAEPKPAEPEPVETGRKSSTSAQVPRRLLGAWRLVRGTCLELEREVRAAAAAARQNLAAELIDLRFEVQRLEVELEALRRAREAEVARLRRDLEIERTTLEQRAAATVDSPFDPWAELARLRIELDRERTERIAREREWLAFTRTLSVLAPGRAAAFQPGTFSVHLPVVDAGPPAPAPVDPAVAESREHAQATLRALRTLLAVEGVRGLDLVELEAVEDGFAGPVLFRLLDDRGRLAGSLWAERLRLEGSRTGRTVTLVLEEGYESHNGVRLSFDAVVGARFPARDSIGFDPNGSEGEAREKGGVRRITLTHVDPLSWVERLPELFGDRDFEEIHDDGTWNLDRVRLGMNALLAEDAAFGHWRLEDLEGVAHGVLRGVHLEFYERGGHLERRVFADRLTIGAGSRGIELVLEDGVQMRGDRKAPFLEGRYRIVLPRADLERWRVARLPGLVANQIPAGTPAPESATEPETPAGARDVGAEGP